MPFAIENIATGERIRQFGSLPKAFDLPDGRRIVAPVAVGDEGLGHRMIEIVEVGFGSPGQFFHQGADTETRVGHVVTITRAWTPWSQAEINAYETGRLDSIAASIVAVDDPVRAALLVVMDELNRHSVVHRAILAAAASGGTYAAFRTAMGAINGLPARQPSDLLGAVRAKLGAA